MLGTSTSTSIKKYQVCINQHQVVSTSIKLFFKLTKVTFSSGSSRKMAFWLFLDQRIRACIKLPEAVQLLDLCHCVSTSFSLPCINSQALICTISWNQSKASQTCLWTRQDFCSPLTGSDLIFAVSACGMGKEWP